MVKVTETLQLGSYNFEFVGEEGLCISHEKINQVTMTRKSSIANMTMEAGQSGKQEIIFWFTGGQTYKFASSDEKGITKLCQWYLK